MIKNQANLFQFNIVDSAGAGRTGLTVTIKLRKDSGTFATATNSVTEVDTTNAPGLYAITFTATECNCDVLTVQATLSNGNNPAILDSYYMQSASSGISAQDVWQYSSRTLSDTPITASDIWSYSGGRTVTNTIPTVSEIQSGLAKTTDLDSLSTFDPSSDTVTVNSTQLSTLATSSALATVSGNVTDIKAKTDNLPASPASTSDVPTTADIWSYSNRSLTVAPSSLTAQEVWAYTTRRLTSSIPDESQGTADRRVIQ